MTKSSPLADRYWSKVERKEPDECWPWLGSSDPKGGHGKILYRSGSNSTTNAHRVAWELAFGPVPPGMYVLHGCDHGWCQNPAHLHLGTHDDNMREAAERHRHGPRPGARAKVDPTEVRRLYKKMSQQKVADRLGISQHVVSDIICRRGAYSK
jgi:hypothetical protein